MSLNSATDIKTLSAIVRLTMNKDFLIVTNWLQSELTRLDKTNRSVKDAELFRWNQGRSQILSDILDTVSTSRDTLNKLR